MDSKIKLILDHLQEAMNQTAQAMIELEKESKSIPDLSKDPRAVEYANS